MTTAGGTTFESLAGYVRTYRAGGYPVAQVRQRVCGPCGGTVFTVLVDDEEGCAATICRACDHGAPIADSEPYLDDADLGVCTCPCGSEEFAVAIGYALHPDEEVRWISVGLRCLTDDTLGVYTDWKIDYLPSTHLLTSN